MKKRNIYVAALISATILAGCSKSASYYNTQGMEQLKANNNVEAVVSLRKAVEKDGSNVVYLSNLATAYEATGQYMLAAQTVEKTLGYISDKEKDDAYYLIATDYLKAKKYDEGIKATENFVNTNYKTYAYYIKGYELLCEHGLVKTAESLLEQAKTLNVTDASDYNNMGQIYYYLGDYEEALKYFENARTAGYNEAVLNVAKVNVILENYTKALSAYEYYEKHVGKTAFVSNQKCVLSIKVGNYADAIAAANEGIAMASVQELRTLLYNRVIAYEKNLDYKTALECMEDYMLKYPDDTTVVDEYEFLKTRN